MARVTAKKRREMAETRKGLAIIIGAALAFAALLGGAYVGDQARGASVAASFADWGL